MILYILGNGFDIAHGLPTSYKYFDQFMEREHPYKKEYYEKNYEDPDKLWSDFENQLTKIDFNYLLEGISDSMRELGENPPIDCGEGSWLYDEIFKGMPSADGLKDYFAKWCATIEITGKTCVRLFELTNRDIYLNFNYTSVLEDIYKIKESRILHIHGYVRAGEVRDNIIVGHSEEPFNYDDHRRIPEEEDYEDPNNLRYLICDETQIPMVAAVCDYCNSLNKKIPERLKLLKSFLDGKDISAIRVFGHSMGPADIPYFKAIQKYAGVHVPWEIALFDNSASSRARIEAIFEEPGKIHFIDSGMVSYRR